MSMITSTTWVPRGFAAPFPTKYTFDEEEFERIAGLAKLQLEDAEEDLQEAEEAEGQESGSHKKGKKSKKEQPSMKLDAPEEFVTLYLAAKIFR